MGFQITESEREGVSLRFRERNGITEAVFELDLDPGYRIPVLPFSF